MSFRYTGPEIERRTFESLSKPIMYLDAKQNELEDKLGLLEGEAAKLKKVALEEPNSKAAKFYNEFMNSVSTTSDSLAKEGIFSNNIRNNVIKLNTIYNSDILPIGQAYDQKMKELERQRVAKLNNQNLRFSKNANEISIDDYMNNTADYKVLDLNRPEQEGMQLGKILSSSNPRTVYKKVLGGQQYEMERTLGYKIDDMLDSGGSFAQIVADYANKIKASYDPELLAKYGNDIDASFKKGVMLGTGQTTQTQLVSNKDYDYMLDIKKQNHASKLRKDEIDYQFNKMNPRPDPNNPTAIPYARGVVNTPGEVAIQTAANVRGEKNALHDVKNWKASPNTTFKATAPILKQHAIDRIDNELSKYTLTTQKSIGAGLAHAGTGAVKETVLKDKRYAGIVDKLIKQKNDIQKNGITMTGKEALDIYSKSYKVSNYDELERKLNSKVILGTHIENFGNEINPEYTSGISKTLYTNLQNTGRKKLELKEISSGKYRNVSSIFDDKGDLNPGIKIGFSPSKKIGYYLITNNGTMYQVSPSTLGISPTSNGSYASDNAINAYETFLNNAHTYKTDKEAYANAIAVQNANTTAINNLATQIGVQVQNPKEHDKQN